MALTPKQEKFCQEYLIDLNATQAEIRAGYSQKTAGSIGQENLTKPEIQSRVTELRLEAQEASGISKEYVLDMIKQNLERAMQAEPVRDSQGAPTGEYKYEGAVANKAAELLGKFLGIFVDKKEITGKDGQPLSAPVIQIVRDSEDKAD